MATRVWRGKRLFDVLASLVLLILLVPAFVVVALAILLSTGRPILFRQFRIGRGGREFAILKFRTMERDAEARLAMEPELGDLYSRFSHKIPAAMDPRITPLGRFLRRTSLDEMPQLVNVLRGEMSLVGPRPVLASELCHYAGHAPCMSLRPGLTGLWQVSGRDEVQFPRRAELDRDYVRNCTLTNDMGILLRTPLVVLSRRGAG